MEECGKTIMEFFKTKSTNAKVKEVLSLCEDVELSYCVLQLLMAHFSENITDLILLADVLFLYIHIPCHTMTHLITAQFVFHFLCPRDLPIQLTLRGQLTYSFGKITLEM